MKSVKTYQNINSENIHANFAISKMEDIYQKIDAPHQHDYFTVMIIKQAKGVHKIDFNTYALRANQIFLPRSSASSN